MRTAGGLLLVTMDVEPALEDELHRWYEEEHVPERLSVPGFVRARRWRAVEGGPKYLALYELESLGALESPEYAHFKGAGATDWTKRMEARFLNFQRNTYELISDKSR